MDGKTSAVGVPLAVGAREPSTLREMANRLANETSPYLLQHQDNPVDWYPWGPEALQRSKEENKPILLSIGYSACHWCHVMEHESFEDPATAAVMNEHFVNIKVDREERPDIDSIYMTAVQQMTGHGGWPMTVFLTPEGVPFYGGTYFPPEPRHGMPSFQQVLLGVSDAYRNRRGEVDRAATELHTILQQGGTLRGRSGDLDTGILDRAFHSLASNFDSRHGGFGGAPKFPQPMNLEFLLRQWHRTGNQDALRIIEQTLRKMAGGGMYDHLGGGFHRYSVDAQWLVPHFEKMLYDNALLSRAYLHAYQATGDAFYARIVDETLAYVLREMHSPEGAFYSTQDADSEGEEGTFYVWAPAEIDAALSPEDAAVFRRYYDVTESGNFEGHNILHTEQPDEATYQRLPKAREILYDIRSRRVWPGRDEKVLTAWNAMMLHSFAEAARVLDNTRYRDAAVQNAEFLLRELWRDGQLLRTYKDGRAKIPAFLEDYALLVDALIALYEATWDAPWVRQAKHVADAMLDRFWEESEGAFYDTAVDAEQLVVRPRDLFDNATPSGNSAATGALLRLAALTGEPRYARVAERVLTGMADLLRRAPSAFGHLLGALDFHLSTPRQVAVIGDPEAADTTELLRVLRQRYLPNTILALASPDAAQEHVGLIPLLAERGQRDGKATAYVCEHFACQQPVNTPEALAEQLTGAVG